MIQKLKDLESSGIRAYTVPEVRVQSGLAVTPSDMLYNSEHGIAISSQVDDSLFYDGDDTSTIEMDPMLMRGVDINDAWNAEQSAKSKLRSAQKRDIEIYGK